MSDIVAELKSKIRLLSQQEKIELIYLLIADLDGSLNANIGKSWSEEAQRRYREIIENEVGTVSGEQVFANAFAP